MKFTMIFAAVLALAISVPVLAKTEETSKDLTPPTVKNWSVSVNHVKEYDEMTDEVFTDQDITAMSQVRVESDCNSNFIIGTKSSIESGEATYDQGVFLCIEGTIYADEEVVMFRFDKGTAEKIAADITHRTLESGTELTYFNIENPDDAAKIINQCKKSSKLLLRVTSGETSYTIPVDLTNFAKAYDVYAKNIPSKK